MRMTTLLKNLAFLLLLAFGVSGVASAKTASGLQNLGYNPHQAESVLNLLWHQEKTGSGTMEASGSSVVANKLPHGNKIDDRPATLYEKYDKDGNFLKHGITKHEDPAKRYTAKQIDDGTVVRTDRGPRSEMIKKERDLVERNPGPDNCEPWAGKRLEE